MEVTVRAARPADADAMGRVFVDSFHAAHRGQIPEWLLHTRTYEGSSKGWARTIGDISRGESPGRHVLVAAFGSELVGVGMGGPPRPWPPDDTARASSRTGECYALYVTPSAHGKGAGAALLRGLARRLESDGVTRLLVGVLSANTPARGFYEHLGGRLLGSRVFDDEGVLLDESVYVWDDLRTWPAPARTPEWHGCGPA